jgi:hypothetical protein
MDNPATREKFEDTKGVIRMSKKDRQHNGQKKSTHNDLQNNTHKTKDRVTRTPLSTEGELRRSGRVGSSCSTSDTHRVTLVTNPVMSYEWGKGLDKWNIYVVICDTDVP